MRIDLVPYTPNSRYLRDAARIYATVWGRDRDDALYFFRRFARYDDFYGYVARVDGMTVGMAFGTYSGPRLWWYDRVAEEVGANHPAIQNTWMITELAVLSAYRGLRIGAALHDQLLKIQPYQRVLLSTQVSNHQARDFYARRGWQTLHPGFAFSEGGTVYTVLHKTLPKPQPA